MVMQSAEEQLYWEAVKRRDLSMDGKFVYAVLSTHVFCRPGCPSRRPRRDRVQFFTDPEDAKQAGFHACLRCRPLEPRPQQIQAVCRYIEKHVDEPLSLSKLGELAGLSPFHLQRKFKAALGITPREYAETCRLKEFKHSVKNGASVTEAIYDAGFGSNSRLYERSQAQLGMQPLAYKQGGPALLIRYTIEYTPIGYMLIGATDIGICSIQFGDTEDGLLAGLKREFPKAELKRDELLLYPHAEQMLAWLRGKRVAIDLPLDIRATAFQRLVWKYLQSIPYGTTESYGEIAKAIGKPAASRAVARACAANPVAVAIPCHRVVQSTGNPGGYKWGAERKQELLRLETNASR